MAKLNAPAYCCRTVCDCPSVGICVLLMAGIVCAHSVVGLQPFQWLVLLLALTGTTVVWRSPVVRSWLLLLAVFMAGGFLSSFHDVQHERSEESAQVITYEYNDLSTLDRAKLRMLDLRKELEGHFRVKEQGGQECAVLCAMVLGDKNGLQDETRRTFSSSGASHVLAISGLHIGIVFQMLFFMLGGRRSRSLLSATLAILAVWSYVFFIGMPASAVRSAFMVSIYCFSLLTHRHSPSVNSLAVAGIVMLLMNPSCLFDLGFQLSFLAVLAILLLYRPLYHMLPSAWYKYAIVKWAWALISVSLAAQIGTMPLVAYRFGTVACYSLLSSFIVIPAVTVILYGSLLLFAVGLLSVCTGDLLNGVQTILAEALGCVSQCTIYMLQRIASLPGACIAGVEMNVIQVLLIYGAIASGCMLIHRLLRYHRYRIRLAVPVDKDCSL